MDNWAGGVVGETYHKIDCFMFKCKNYTQNIARLQGHRKQNSTSTANQLNAIATFLIKSGLLAYIVIS